MLEMIMFQGLEGVTNGMSTPSVIGLVAGGVATVIGALKLPEYYKYRSARDEEINRLTNIISNIRTGVNQLSIIMKNALPDEAMAHESLDEIMKLINSDDITK